MPLGSNKMIVQDIPPGAPPLRGPWLRRVQGAPRSRASDEPRSCQAAPSCLTSPSLPPPPLPPSPPAAPGTLSIYPQGLMHVQFNTGCDRAEVFVTFDKPNP